MDIAPAILNLGTKLMRWTSSIDCDRVGVCSLAVCQCGDGVEVLLTNGWMGLSLRIGWSLEPMGLA